MVRRAASTLRRAWSHRLAADRLLDAFLDCAARLIDTLSVDDGTARVRVALGVEELAGAPDDVRAELTVQDHAAFEHATLRITGAGTKRSAVTLTADATTIALRARRIRNADALRAAIGAVENGFGLSASAQRGGDGDAAPDTQAERNDRLRPGLAIDNYVLRKRLGAGFTGEVWQAEVATPPPGIALEAGASVAMKLYFPHILAKHTETIRIQREFHVAAEIEHENIVRVFDLVLSPSRPFSSFLVMELLDGPTLKQAIPEGGLELAECLAVGRQLASALVELHGRGVLHRDIKPANVMCLDVGDGLHVKLLDLGIVAVEEDQGLTENSLMLGSKHTCAPEQLFGDAIDERSDIYGLGATLAHCYSGAALYNETGPATAIARQMIRSPEKIRPRKGSSKLDRDFVDFLARCTRIAPAERPESAAECLATLEALAERAARPAVKRARGK